MKRILCILFASLFSTFSWAGVIPEDYDYVLLPNNTVDINYRAFTSINSRGFAIGYGTSDNQYVGFLFNYETKSIEAIFDDFWPVGINDNNKIVGVDILSPNFILKQCTYSAGVCDLRSIDAAERVFPYSSTGITNSDIIIAHAFIGTPDYQH